MAAPTLSPSRTDLDCALAISKYLTLGMHHMTPSAQFEIACLIREHVEDEKRMEAELVAPITHS